MGIGVNVFARSLPSIAFVTMHKAGSVLVNEMLKRITGAQGYTHVDLAGQAFYAGQQEHLFCIGQSDSLKPLQHYYGAFRGPYVRRMRHLDTMRLVVQVRDPRDCIVSLYYSLLHSHGRPGDGPARKVYERNLATLSVLGVDGFALTQRRQYAVRMKTLSNLLNQHPDTLLLRYKTMIEARSLWLTQLTQYLKMQPSAETRAWFHSETTSNSVEDHTLHRRQMLPGDYKRKLSRAVQAQISGELIEHLEEFGYAEAQPKTSQRQR